MNPLLGLLAARVQGTPLGGLLGLIDGASARGGMRQGSSDGTRTMEMRPEMLDAYRETPRTMEMRPEMAGAYIVEPLGRSGPPAAHRTAPPPLGRSEAAWGEAPDPGPLPMQGLPASIVRTESGGDWNALNSEGYGGRGQFGTARLADAYRAGVIPRPMTGAEYSRAPAEVQLAVENWHRNDILGQLGRYVGTDVDGSGPIPPLTENSLLAVAHLGGTGGARRFIESGGRYDPADSNGTNLSDYAMTHAGGGSMSNASTGGAPVGLLGSSRPQGGGLLGRAAPAPLTAMPAPERRRSIFDRLEGVPVLGGLADPDRRARLQIALEGMTLNPNEGLIEMAQGDIADGREQERLARTAAWLAENGGQDFAAALMAGVDPAQAVGGFMESRQPQEPINAGGGLFLDPVTLEPVADYRQSEGAGLTEVSPGATLYDPTTGQEVYRAPTAAGDPAERRIITQGGVSYYEDTGEPVLPDAPVPDSGGLDLGDLGQFQTTYRGDERVRGYIDRSDAYGTMRTAYANDDDVAFAIAYMKMLDPTSVVREEEGRMVAEAGGLNEATRGMIQGILDGNPITDTVAGKFMTTADGLLAESEAGYAQAYDYYSGLASDYMLPEGQGPIDYRRQWGPWQDIRPVALPPPPAAAGGATPSATPAPAASAAGAPQPIVPSVTDIPKLTAPEIDRILDSFEESGVRVPSFLARALDEQLQNLEMQGR